uniref:Adaptor protein, phosphotyrosine interacting with PH domain and leucine zipper 2 n=1 Tax=Oryzias sinensis TaxID=183150 RepID=A0A8C7ZZR3_9TELE
MLKFPLLCFFVQTRSLLSVFEEDAGMLTEYTNQLLQSMQRVFGAQSEMGLATEQLSQRLLEYEKKASRSFSLNSLHSELANQMADSMVFPLIQFREKDLTEISTLKEIFGIATDEHEAAMVKYSRLPKKKENEKLKADLVKEVAYTRRKQHQASLQYYCALNALQYRKRVAMLEPMLGYTQAQISFFKKGIELVSKKMDTFLSSVSNMMQNIQTQLDSEAEAMRMSQKELLSADDAIYMPDKDSEPVNRTLIQKDLLFFLADSLLQQVFAVRFLGSMAVRCGNNREVIYEAMRQVLAARAIHNIFRTTESHLMITSSSLRLIDPQTQVTRISFQLEEVCQFAAHQENGRLMGFVVEGIDWSDGNGEGEPSFSAFVFESNTEGEKICYTINLAKDITEAKKDPEALAELMKNMPLTNDGKFLLLEPETGDTDDGAGPEDLESEA